MFSLGSRSSLGNASSFASSHHEIYPSEQSYWRSFDSDLHGGEGLSVFSGDSRSTVKASGVSRNNGQNGDTGAVEPNHLNLTKSDSNPSAARTVRFSQQINRLHRLVAALRWDDAIVRCFQAPREARVWFEEVDQNGICVQQLPIHRVFAAYNTMSLSREGLARPPRSLIKMLVEAYREGLKLSDHNGDLAIHLAIKSGPNVDESIISLLIKTCKESLRIKNGGGSLPLHLACEFLPSNLTIIQAIVSIYPKASIIEDTHGRTPLQILHKSSSNNKSEISTILANARARAGSNSSRSTMDSSSRGVPGIKEETKPTTPSLPSEESQRSYVSIFHLISQKKWSAVEARCKERPEEACVWHDKKNRDGDGLKWRLLPLHRACELCPTPGVVNALIEAYPKALAEKDHGGRHPLHSACRRNADPVVVNILINGFTSALRIKDSKGRLPIQVALEHSASKAALMVLLSHYSGVKNHMLDRCGISPLDRALSDKSGDLFAFLSASRLQKETGEEKKSTKGRLMPK